MNKNRKAIVFAIIFFISMMYLDVHFLHDYSFWYSNRNLAEDEPGGVLQYIVSFTVIIIASVFEYNELVDADKEGRFFLTLLAAFIVWPLKWIIICLIISIPNIFIGAFL